MQRHFFAGAVDDLVKTTQGKFGHAVSGKPLEHAIISHNDTG